MAAMPNAVLRPVLVNRRVGDLVSVKGRTMSIMGFTVARGRIVEIDAMADPERVRRIAGAFGGKRD